MLNHEEPVLEDSWHPELLRLWNKFLKTADVSIDDDFFEKGGNSLLAIDLLLELQRLIGRQLPEELLFEASTVRVLRKDFPPCPALRRRPSLKRHRKTTPKMHQSVMSHRTACSRVAMGASNRRMTDQWPNPVFETALAYQRTAALTAAVRLDIFSLIGSGAATVEAIALRTEASPRGARILCDYLTVIGLLQKQES